MLWLLRVDAAGGTFFDRIAAERPAWLGAHVVLLLSTVLLLPAALGLRSRIGGGKAGGFATGMVLLVAPTAILLAGQYALDFAVPSMLDVGGAALKVNATTRNAAPSGVLFYGLPNLVFLAMMALSLTVAWRATAVPRIAAVVLSVNWAVVLLGNLIHPALQRGAIVLLALAHLPLMKVPVVARSPG